MAAKRRGVPAASVELTPLIDIVFLLLIFFAASSVLMRENRLDIELPSASGAPRNLGDALLEIAVDRQGGYALNGRPLPQDSPEALAAALAAAVQKQEASPEALRLVVRADALASHQSVVRALEAAGQAGLTQIRLATRPPD